MDRGHGVAEGECGKLLAAASKDRVGGNHESICLELCPPREAHVEIAFADRLEYQAPSQT